MTNGKFNSNGFEFEPWGLTGGDITISVAYVLFCVVFSSRAAMSSQSRLNPHWHEPIHIDDLWLRAKMIGL